MVWCHTCLQEIIDQIRHQRYPELLHRDQLRDEQQSGNIFARFCKACFSVLKPRGRSCLSSAWCGSLNTADHNKISNNYSYAVLTVEICPCVRINRCFFPSPRTKKILGFTCGSENKGVNPLKLLMLSCSPGWGNIAENGLSVSTEWCVFLVYHCGLFWQLRKRSHSPRRTGMQLVPDKPITIARRRRWV